MNHLRKTILFCILVFCVSPVFQNCSSGFSKTQSSTQVTDPLDPNGSEGQSQQANISVQGLPDSISHDSFVDIEVFLQNTQRTYHLNCYLDGKLLEHCLVPQRLGALADGPHTLRIEESTGALPPFEYTWTTALPNFSLQLNGPSSPNPQQSLEISYSFINPHNLPVNITCELDNQTLLECDSPISLDNLSLGNHQLKVSVLYKDRISVEDSVSWTTDHEVFNLEMVDGPIETQDHLDRTINGTNEESPSFSFRLTDSNNLEESATVECGIENKDSSSSEPLTLIPCDFPTHSFAEIEDGRYRAVFEFTDRFSRKIFFQLEFTKDSKSLENLRILTQRDFKTHHRALLFPIAADVPENNLFSEKIEYKLIGHHSDFQKIDVSHTSSVYASFILLNNLPLGEHQLIVRGKDAVGNQTEPSILNFTITENAEVLDAYEGGAFEITKSSIPARLSSNLIGMTFKNILVIPKQKTEQDVHPMGVINTHLHYWLPEEGNTLLYSSPLRVSGLIITGGLTPPLNQLIFSNEKYAVLKVGGTRLITLDIQKPLQPKLVRLDSINSFLQLVNRGNTPYFIGHPLGDIERLPGKLAIYQYNLSDPLDPKLEYLGQNLDTTHDGSNYPVTFFRTDRIGDSLVMMGTRSGQETIFKTYKFHNDPTTPQLLATKILPANHRVLNFWVDGDHVAYRIQDRTNAPDYTYQLDVADIDDMISDQVISEGCPARPSASFSLDNTLSCYDEEGTHIYGGSGNYSLLKTIPDIQLTYSESPTRYFEFKRPFGSRPGHLKYYKFGKSPNENLSEPLELQWTLDLTSDF